MMLGYLYLDSTLLLLIPGIVLALWAQTRVRSVFHQYSGIFSNNGWTAEMMARRILDENGLHDVQVTGASGILSDHYNPRRQVLRLSRSVYGSSSLAALGVAATGRACAAAPVWLRADDAAVGDRPCGQHRELFGVAAAHLWNADGKPDADTVGRVRFRVRGPLSARDAAGGVQCKPPRATLLEEGGYLTEMELPGARKVLNAAA